MTIAPDPAIRWWCRLVILLPVVVQGGVIALGLVPMPWDFFKALPHLSNQQFLSYYGYSALCSASTIPLIVVAWKLRNPAAHGTGKSFELWSGIKRVFLYAVGQVPNDSVPAFTQPVTSDTMHRKALALGVTAAIFLPTFFLGVGPLPHTFPVMVWIIGAGIIVGASIYVDRRASPYVVQRANRFDPFWGFRMMNPARYDPAAHRFVWWKIILGILVPIWWLGGGVWAIGSGSR